MPDAALPRTLDVAERDGPGGRVVLRGAGEDSGELIVIAGYAGAKLPERLTGARLEPDAAAGRWRLTASEGRFEFGARAVDRFRLRPALYEPLHRSFALSTGDRVAVRVLLCLLRLPGGARLMRRWHARRAA